MELKVPAVGQSSQGIGEGESLNTCVQLGIIQRGGSLCRQPAQHSHIGVGEPAHLLGSGGERANDPVSDLDRGRDGASGLEANSEQVFSVVMGADVLDPKGLAIHQYGFGYGVREGPGGSYGKRDFPDGCSHGATPVFMRPDPSPVEMEKFHRRVGDPLQDLFKIEGTHQDSTDLFQLLRFERAPL